MNQTRVISRWNILFYLQIYGQLGFFNYYWLGCLFDMLKITREIWLFQFQWFILYCVGCNLEVVFINFICVGLVLYTIYDDVVFHHQFDDFGIFLMFLIWLMPYSSRFFLSTPLKCSYSSRLILVIVHSSPNTCSNFK